MWEIRKTEDKHAAETELYCNSIDKVTDTQCKTTCCFDHLGYRKLCTLPQTSYFKLKYLNIPQNYSQSSNKLF